MQTEPVRRRPRGSQDGDAADDERCDNTSLRKATRRVSQLYDSVLAPGGLRNTQRSILHHVERQGSATLGALAASLVLDRSALGHNLKPLERDGYVVVEVDPADRRNRLARLTPEGADILRRTAVLWTAAQQRFEDRFGAARAKALRATLARVAATDFDDAGPARPRDGVPAGSDDNRCNITALKKASRRVSQFYDAVLAPTGLRSTQRSLLRTIARLGSPSMSQLATALVLDRSALGHNVRPLEREGLIVLETDPGDRRNRLATLTPAGQRKLREAAVLWQTAQERFEHKFGAAQAKALRAELAAIAAAPFDPVP